MPEPTLHELVDSYRRGAAPKARVMERVAGLVYRDPERFGFDDADDAADALERHGTRIVSMADRFEERGISFDSYLRTSLRYLARSMRRERRRRVERELVCERALAAFDASSRGEEVRHLPRGYRISRRTRSQGVLISPPVSGKARALADAEVEAFASRLMFLALKCAWEVGDELVDRIAEACGVEPEWLGSALAQARRSLEAERARFERLADRRNRSWCRLRLLEARLREVEVDGENRPMRESLARERERFERVRAELAAFRPVVPNSVVARILGVPKGTVDSGLYYLKRRAKALEDSP